MRVARRDRMMTSLSEPPKVAAGDPAPNQPRHLTAPFDTTRSFIDDIDGMSGDPLSSGAEDRRVVVKDGV
jgi:hypothetical protein